MYQYQIVAIYLQSQHAKLRGQSFSG